MPTPPMAEVARWLEWQGRSAVARTAAVALGAGAAAATAGAFIHAAFTPGANRWLRVPDVITTRYLSHAQQTHTTAPAQPLGPVTTVACRLIALTIALTAQMRPLPLPLEELHGPDDGSCDADALVRAALATPGLRLRVLRLQHGHAVAPHVAAAALTAWGPTSLIEWHAEVAFAYVNDQVDTREAESIVHALEACRVLRVLRCDTLPCLQLPAMPSVRVLTIIHRGHVDPSVWAAHIAACFPHVERLQIGPRPGWPQHPHDEVLNAYTPLFGRLPSLSQITWCVLGYPVRAWIRREKLRDMGQQVIARPQARRVAFFCSGRRSVLRQALP
jgi:hypothetical protein